LILLGTAAFTLLLFAFAAPALAKDANKDKIPDSWEKKNHLSLNVKQTHRDQDRDKLVNRDEWKNGTDPHKADTDGDGISDGDEIKFGLDPTDPNSLDEDVSDGEQIVGTIASFDGTTLTIKLLRGGTASGVIDPLETDIECDRYSADEDLDGTCLPTDLLPGVLVNYASYDDANPSLFDEVDLVGVS